MKAFFQQLKMVNSASLARLLLVVSVLLISLSGCGQSDHPTQNNNSTPPPPYNPPPRSQILYSVNNLIISGGHWVTLPSDGAFVQAGSTLSLSWSADGYLDVYIFTENQYNNFKRGAFVLYWEAHKRGSSGTISANIENGDTYYGVVRNGSLLLCFNGSRTISFEEKC